MRVILTGLVLWGGCVCAVAQPVETSQLPKKVLPNDPVGNLFNDGPRVVYTQESGADPIERLFWDREQKKERLRRQIEALESKRPEATIDPAQTEPKKEDPQLVSPPDTSVAESAADINKPISDQKPDDAPSLAEPGSKNTDSHHYQNKNKIHAKESADSATPQPLKRAADAGRVDGVRINGASWPVSTRPKNTYGKQRVDGRPWQGLVFDVPVGTHVKAIDAGRVMYANDFKNYGNLVIIDHGDRVASVYANNQKLLVKEGDLIGTGDLIALSGQTGSLDYPALYFEIRKEGKPVDPLQFLKRR